MKLIKQNPGFSIPAILLPLFCFAMMPSASAMQMGPSTGNPADSIHTSQPAADMSRQRTVDQQNAPLRLFMVAENNAESVSDEEADMEARRQQMIEYCEANRGVDCERKVDIELEAQQDGGASVYDSPDQTHRPIRPRPRPKISP